jgi:uncharacterized protein (DUF885 family)
MRKVHFGSKLLVLLFLVSGMSVGQATSAKASLDSVIDRAWQYRLSTEPEFASFTGDHRFSAQLRDYSPAALRDRHTHHQQFLRELQAIDAKHLDSQDVVNRAVLIRELQDQVVRYALKLYEMPVDQMNGIHLELPDLPRSTRFETRKDFDDYVARLHQIPRVLDQNMDLMRAGMKDGLVPPRYLLEKVAPEADDIAVEGDKSPFAEPLQHLPASLSRHEQQQVRSQLLSAISADVVPAYKKFARFVREEYAPKGRSEPGVWSIPNGAEIYRQAIREQTTTEMDPETIHQLGLKQVASIQAEMLKLAQTQGYKDLASFNAAIRKDPSHYGKSGQQIMDLYQHYTDQMYAKLPSEFGKLPANKLQVVPMEAYRAPNAVPADYSIGSPGNGKPGRINVNEYDPQHRLLLNVEAIAYHEGIPGHHLQFSIGQELTGLPEFRKYTGFNAFSEGWALYAERLGKDVGFYQDPYSEYGRLQNEMWRAVRLVVDTGVHAKHWSRQQMIDYFHQYTAMDDLNIATEVDRYIAWPAQALGYKLGQMTILDLRQQAQQALGPRFDIRGFHDAVLANGSVPLDVLKDRVSAWIQSQKALPH